MPVRHRPDEFKINTENIEYLYIESIANSNGIPNNKTLLLFADTKIYSKRTISLHFCVSISIPSLPKLLTRRYIEIKAILSVCKFMIILVTIETADNK